jgi:hypothetical protein
MGIRPGNSVWSSVFGDEADAPYRGLAG